MLLKSILLIATLAINSVASSPTGGAHGSIPAPPPPPPPMAARGKLTVSIPKHHQSSQASTPKLATQPGRANLLAEIRNAGKSKLKKPAESPNPIAEKKSPKPNDFQEALKLSLEKRRKLLGPDEPDTPRSPSGGVKDSEWTDLDPRVPVPFHAADQSRVPSVVQVFKVEKSAPKIDLGKVDTKPFAKGSSSSVNNVLNNQKSVNNGVNNQNSVNNGLVNQQVQANPPSQPQIQAQIQAQPQRQIQAQSQPQIQAQPQPQPPAQAQTQPQIQAQSQPQVQAQIQAQPQSQPQIQPQVPPAAPPSPPPSPAQGQTPVVQSKPQNQPSNVAIKVITPITPSPPKAQEINQKSDWRSMSPQVQRSGRNSNSNVATAAVIGGVGAMGYLGYVAGNSDDDLDNEINKF